MCFVFLLIQNTQWILVVVGAEKLSSVTKQQATSHCIPSAMIADWLIAGILLSTWRTEWVSEYIGAGQAVAEGCLASSYPRRSASLC